MYERLKNLLNEFLKYKLCFTRNYIWFWASCFIL